MDNDTRDAVEAGDLHGCRRCHEVSEGDHCPACDEGRCGICGCLIAKGEPVIRDTQFGGVYCAPDCAEIADQPTVADIARRLAVGGGS